MMIYNINGLLPPAPAPLIDHYQLFATGGSAGLGYYAYNYTFTRRCPVSTRAANEGPHTRNHGEGTYYDLLFVESGYNRFHI